MFKHLIIATTLVVSARAGATTVKDLAVSCGGHYKVLSAEPFFKDNTGTRAPSYAGTTEKIQVLSVHGQDCAKIKEHYGISVEKGQIVDFGVATAPSYEAAKAEAAKRHGQTFAFKASQSFSYVSEGTLPLFPVVHSEAVSLLSFSGQANAKALYGTPAVSELTDEQVSEVLGTISWQVDWGKKYQQQSWDDEWLQLALELSPKTDSAKKAYLTRLLLFFDNATQFGGSFVTFAPELLLGHKINELLNELGGTQWATKLHVWKHHPLLFNDHLVSWARFTQGEVTEAPILSPEELEEYLAFAYEQAQALKVVKWVGEANVFLYSFKGSASAILNATRPNGSLPPLYALTPKGQELADKLLAFQ